jgi:hypothetical protein
MRVVAGLLKLSLVAIACGARPPPPPVEPPRLPAEEACTGVDLVATPLPVPPRPAPDPYRYRPVAAVFAKDGATMSSVAFVCDLPDHVLAIAAEQGVEGGRRKIGGRVWSIARSATAPPIGTLAIDPSSSGCRTGEVTCTWKTSSPAIPAIDTLPNQRVPTSGWVHGAEDMCRALPDDTIAFCSTATRMAYVELGCNAADAPPVALELGIHDASVERRFDLDVEVPVARLRGAAEQAGGTSYRYAFRGAGDAQGSYKTATLAIDLATNAASLELDGAREDCLAFGIYRR